MALATAALAFAKALAGSLGWGDSDWAFSEKSGAGTGDARSAALFLPGAGVSKFPPGEL